MVMPRPPTSTLVTRAKEEIPSMAPLVECYDDTWCPPVGCTMRRCDEGVCVNAGGMSEEVETFNLLCPLQCNQTTNRKCVVAVRNYLVALTSSGFTVFNTRNPYSIRQEAVPDNIGGGYSYLVRSGERVWAVKNSSGTTTQVAWIDVPLDGVSPLSSPSSTTLYVQALSARHAAPNDSIYLYSTDFVPAGYVARYSPGLPTTLQNWIMNGTNELTAMASSGARLLMHERVQFSDNPITYRHNFSLQSDLLSSTSTNSGTHQETSLTNIDGTYGYFASGRTGSIAWLIGRRDSTPEWKDVRWSTGW